MDDAALRLECERCGAPVDDIPENAMSGGATCQHALDMAVTVIILFLQDHEGFTQVSHFFNMTTWSARYLMCSHFCFDTIQLYTVRYQSWPSGREDSERSLVRAWL